MTEKGQSEMKYIVYIERDNGPIYTEKYDYKEEAIWEADQMWEEYIMADEARKHVVSFYVLESADPDKDSPERFGGNIVKNYK
jgi:hypothetical protein